MISIGIQCERHGFMQNATQHVRLIQKKVKRRLPETIQPLSDELISLIS